MRGILLLLLGLCASAAFADTTFVTGPHSGEWFPTGNPFLVRDSVTIEHSNSLVIHPGCVVLFADTSAFIVRGVLRAEGTETDSIFFTCDTLTNTRRWLGLRFLSADTGSVLNYCVVEYGRAFTEGITRYAGGIEIQNCSPRIEHSSIRYNAAAVDGGGIYMRDNARPVIRFCTVANNRTNYGGGGLMIRQSRPTIENCTITANFAGHNGGGLVCRNGSVPYVTDCMISNNSTPDSGGGIYSLHSSTVLTLERCTISGNSAARGGGVYADRSSPYIYRTRLTGNFAIVEGGAFFGDEFSSGLVNCLTENNRAQVSGGAVFFKNSVNSLLEFCTFTGDSAPQGGVVYNFNSNTLLRNNIFHHWKNGAAVFNASDQLPSVITNCLSGSAGGLFVGPRAAGQGVIDRVNLNQDSCDVFGNVLFDPQFVDHPNANYELLDDSPCVSAGTQSFETSDYFGRTRPRPLRTQPDMGAFESDRGGSGYICGFVRGIIGPGDVVVGCNVTIAAGDTLTIDAGTRLQFAGRFSMKVLGTLLVNGTESDSVWFTRRLDDPATNWRGLRFVSGGRGTVSYAVFEYAEGTDFNADSGCGAILCDGTLPRFAHCSIRNNLATYRGGGVACYHGSIARFDTCEIIGNSCTGPLFSYGGGVSSTGAQPRFRGCRILNNVASWGGGGIHADSGNTSFTNCEISGNHSRSGGGIYSVGEGLTVSSSTISANTCDEDGAGIFARSFARFERCTITANFGTGIRGGGAFVPFYAAVFDHCTFTGNSADRGGGIYVESASPTVQNCTIVENTATDGDGIYLWNCAPTINSSIVAMSAGSGIYFRGGTAFSAINYCDFFANPGGDFSFFNDDHNLGPANIGLLSRVNANGDSTDGYDNIFLAAQFVNSGAGDYNLLENSPCVNAGDPTSAPDPDGSRADIGAFFYTRIYHPPSPFVLLSPADRDTLRQGREPFCWQASLDEDRGDSVVYTIVLTTEDGDRIDIPARRDTCSFVYLDTLGLADSLEIGWFVIARSFLPPTEVNSSGLWRFTWIRTVDAEEPHEFAPREFRLDEIFPNPFNNSATIRLALPRASHVVLELYDITGRRTAQLFAQEMSAGVHTVPLHGEALPSGVYFVRMTAVDVVQSRKILLLK